MRERERVGWVRRGALVAYLFVPVYLFFILFFSLVRWPGLIVSLYEMFW